MKIERIETMPKASERMGPLHEVWDAIEELKIGQAIRVTLDDKMQCLGLTQTIKRTRLDLKARRLGAEIWIERISLNGRRK